MKISKKVKEIVLIVLLIIVLMVPIFIMLNNNRSNDKYNKLITQIEEAAKDYAIQQTGDSNSIKVKLGDLKKISLMPINVKNPKTNKHLSNESYVIVTKENGEYKSETKLYDIPDKETAAQLIITLNGEQKLQNGISATYTELGAVFVSGTKEIDYSVQYFLKGEEVLKIDSSIPKNYEVVYTALNSEGVIAKKVRTVIVQ